MARTSTARTPRKNTKAADEEADVQTASDATKTEPFRRLDPEAFFKLVKTYPDPAGCWLYIYRLEPEIVRQNAGIAENYIKRWEHPFPHSAEAIFSAHGGGKYQLTFNDNKREQNRVAKTIIEEDWRIREPNLNYTELVSSNANAPYLQYLVSKGAIVVDPETKKIIPVMGGNGGQQQRVIVAQAPAQATNSTDHMILSRLLDHALTEKGQQGESMNVTELVKLVTTFMTGRPTDPAMEEMKRKLDTLVAEREEIHTKLLQSIVTRLENLQNPATPAAPAKSPMETLTEALTLYTTLKEQIEPAASPAAAVAAAIAPESPIWQQGLNALFQAATPIVTNVGYYLTNRYLGQAAAAEAEGPPALPPARPPAGYAQPLDDSPRVQTAAQPRPTAPAAPQKVSTADPLRTLVATVHYCLDRERPGSSLAVYLELHFRNLGPYKQLCGMGKEALIGQMKLVTDIWPLIEAYGPQRLETFIAEFLTAFEEVEETADV